MDNETFLGEGWSFPPHFDKKTGELVTTTGFVDINKSLEILLSTRLGERIMLPNYGCNLEELLFQPMDVSLKTYIKKLIKTAILYFEPRIDTQKNNPGYYKRTDWRNFNTHSIYSPYHKFTRKYGVSLL